MPEENTTLPLEGIKVVELATYAAGPICAMTLADWGADVIKVESLGGDVFRSFGINMNCQIKEDDNICFELVNRNKRGIAVDLKSDDGKKIIGKLLEYADVFSTNMRPNALKRLGMDYETLSNQYPRLIYAYLNGYGDEGPEKDKPGFDLAAYFARSGILVEFGEPGTEPLPPVAGFGDHTTGTFLAGGICAALLQRARTNKGCKVQVSLYNAALWNLSQGIASANNTEGGYRKSSRKKPVSALMNTYKTGDGKWLTIMAIEYERYWGPFCEQVIKRPDLAINPRYSTFFASYENSAELVAIVQSEFDKYTSQELVQKLRQADVVYELNQRWHELKNDPQATETGFMMEYKLPSGRTDWVIGNPAKFNGGRTLIRRKAPLLGEHTGEVLRKMGYPEESIADLTVRKIIK